MSDALTDITVAKGVSLAVIVAVTLVLFVLMRRVQAAGVRRAAIRPYTADMIRRITMVFVAFVAGLAMLDVLEIEIGLLIGGLGISGLIVAVALQPLLANFVGSILLHGTRAFRPGDEILTNGIAGTVIDISHRAVQLEDYDGNAVYVPNMRVLDSPLVNLTADDPRRTLIGFQVAYDTDLRATVAMVTEALIAVDGVAAKPPVQVVVRSFGESGIDLEAEVWHPAEEATARMVVSEAAITLRETLAANDVTIPFPQRVLHRPAAE